jgi:hypothetical protein
VPQKLALLLAVILPSFCLPASAQKEASPSASTQPQVKVNVLNVCSPSAEEQQEIAAALGRIPKHPSFSSDFEVSYGRSTLTDTSNLLPGQTIPGLTTPGQSVQNSDAPSVARYVRIRHELSEQSGFSSVQYSFSDDGENMVETLVLHVRDPKDLIQLSIEDSASAVGSAQSMLAANTPASRIRLERFGKSSVALVRCTGSENGPAPDQSAYEPLFHSGSEVMTNYRGLLSVRRTVPVELAQVSSGAKAKAKTKSAPSPDSKK